MGLGNTVKDGTGSSFWQILDTEGRSIVVPAWVMSLQSDTALNDSDKTLTVPASTEWRVNSIWVELITTATATNRQLVIEIQDGSADVIMRIKPGTDQAPSLTYNYLFAPDVVNLTTILDTTYLSTPMPLLILPTTYVIRVYDNNAVDAAADDMVIHARVETRPV